MEFEPRLELKKLLFALLGDCFWGGGDEMVKENLEIGSLVSLSVY